MGPGSLPKAREGNALSMAAAAPEMCVTIVRKCESIPGQQGHIQRGNARKSKTEKKATFFFTHHLRMGVHPDILGQILVRLLGTSLSEDVAERPHRV